MKTKDKITNLERRNPVGVDSPRPLCPKVARSSQPWAEGRNPFGIGPDGALALCESKRLTGWVLYDGECGLCTGWAQRFEAVLNRRGFELAPLQTPWVREQLGLLPEAVLTEMRLLLSDGSVYGGADAIIEIARRIWWGWPVFLFGRLPGGRSAMRAIYRRIAARRRCSSGACQMAPRIPKFRPPGFTLWWLDWVPMALLTSHALIVRNELPGWAFMWLMAWAIFFGCKFATWQRAWRRGARPAIGRSLAYLFAWPGMDAAAFLTQTERGHSCPQQVGLDNEASTNSKPWRVLGLLRTGMSALRSSATASILGGAIPIWVAARYGQGIQPLARGWVAMIGIVLFLHFGLFQLLALAWRRAGVNATPLMCRPLASTSLADFWSGRWNTAFNAVARDLVFRPLAPRLGGTAALIVVFLVSGLVHEAVISLPARAGYGLPTAYFALQAMGVALERNACGRRLGLGHGIRGWSFVMVCAGLPAFFLFHPPFVRNVILPMLDAIGAM